MKSKAAAALIALSVGAGVAHADPYAINQISAGSTNYAFFIIKAKKIRGTMAQATLDLANALAPYGVSPCVVNADANGTIVCGNPATPTFMARANIESGIVYGLSSVLHERVTLKDGKVQQSNFHDYHVMRMSDMPEVMEVAFVERDAPPSGLGEIGNPWVAAALANAFHRLTGKRLKHMPFTPARVQEALKA